MSKLMTIEEVMDPWHEAREMLGPVSAKILQDMGLILSTWQLEILACDKQFLMAAGAIHGGKSTLSRPKTAIEYPKDLVRHPPALVKTREYWLAGDTIEDCNEEWTAILDYFLERGAILDQHEDPPWFILDDGIKTTFRVKYTRGGRRIARTAPLGIIVCEAAHIHDLEFQELLGRAMLRNAWMFITGSWEQQKHPWFLKKFQEWSLPNDVGAAFILPTFGNPALFPKGEQDPKIQQIKANSSDRWYRERILGEPTAPAGLVYPEFNPKFHLMRGYEVNYNEPVHVWHDPGYRHAAAVLFVQIYGGVVYVFDSIYAKGRTTADIIEMCKAKHFWGHVDIRLVVDPYYRTAHQSQSSVGEMWIAAGVAPADNKRHPIGPGIDLVKSLFRPHPETQGPQILIEATTCLGLLSELGICPSPIDNRSQPYVYKLDMDGNQLRDTPEDEHNDACDALRFGLVETIGFRHNPYEAGYARYAPSSTPDDRGDFRDLPELAGSIQVDFGHTIRIAPDPFHHASPVPDRSDYYAHSYNPMDPGEGWPE